ncbi:hypothetical protein NDU88_007276 [Pleurodeles waltl]|uniref:Uncharacterized protein n=1 Tax=Pleurodeles waltl TaxID=8319 RepID=A0AAV7N3A2_PLEWA|nr:hypothetical protein NDU88_007276 [Pleurodeles waltl]
MRLGPLPPLAPLAESRLRGCAGGRDPAGSRVEPREGEDEARGLRRGGGGRRLVIPPLPPQLQQRRVPVAGLRPLAQTGLRSRLGAEGWRKAPRGGLEILKSRAHLNLLLGYRTLVVEGPGQWP